jgi:Family of unknown function (DUF6962)
MNLAGPPTELTTSVTDALLAVECVFVCVRLWMLPNGDRWRVGLWCWVFGLLAFASLLGSVAHGIEMPPTWQKALWKPLNFALGLVVALFMVGAVLDWQGRVLARRLVPWSLGLGSIFFVLMEILNSGFILFDIYLAVAMAAALAIYAAQAATHRLKGAIVVAAAICLNLTAAGVQASDLSLNILVPFDHNGLFHFVQMAAITLLWWGISLGMKPVSASSIVIRNS